tara:strand:+ start:237 stop:668 length:432 start_codon:yes stop_codon:yes gene_type:complete
MAKSIQIPFTNAVVFLTKSANLYTLATNEIDLDHENLYVNIRSQASGLDLAGGTLIAGDNVDVIDVKPPYMPYMVEGAFYAGLTTSLTLCDLELTDYQYIAIAGTTQFFVWGICGATQTQFYTPKLMSGAAVVWKTNFTQRVR